MKSLQFEIWQECNSRCKFCYLGDDNIKTPDSVKIKSMQEIYNKISDNSLYSGQNPIEILSYLGGEFFQGQLNTPEIRNLFFDIMKKTADLFNSGMIKQVWIYATMTIGDQKDLYEVLDLFDKSKKGLWVLTSYDTVGRFHTQKMLDTWIYNMKRIHKEYPLIEFNTTTIVSQDLIEKYLKDEYSPKKFMEEFHTSLFFKQCGGPPTIKEKLNNFFPRRKYMLKFLSKFYLTEGPELYDKLFNIKYRADDLYRNYNDGSIMYHIKRDKFSKKEEKPAEEYNDNPPLLPCGHLESYGYYDDPGECVFCDKKRILSMYENSTKCLTHE